MARLTLVGVVLAVIVLGVWGMSRGWSARAARQAHIPPPPQPPDDLAEVPAVSGLYVATTISGDWLDRVAVHGLGDRGRARAMAGPAGLLVRRQGAGDIWIARASLRAVTLGQGLAQKVFEPAGLIIVTWQVGEVLLDTGFRADDPQQHVALAQALAGMVDIGGGGR